MIKGLNIQATNKNERYELLYLMELEEKAKKINEELFEKAFNIYANEIKPQSVEQVQTLMLIVIDIIFENVNKVNQELAESFENLIEDFTIEDGVYYIEGYEDGVFVMATIENGAINVTIEDTRKANIYGDDTVNIEKTYKTVKGAVKFIEKYI